MLRWRKKIRYLAYILFDLFCILCALLLSRIIFISPQNALVQFNPLEFIGLFTYVSCVYVFLYYVTNTYEDTIESEGNFTSIILIKMLIVSILSILMIHLLIVAYEMNLNMKSIATICLVILISQLAGRMLIKYIEFGKNDVVQAKNLIMVGVSEAGNKFITELHKHDYLNYRILGYVRINEEDTYSDLVPIGSLDNLEEIIIQHIVDELVIAKPLSFDTRLREKVDLCQCMGITITMVLDLQNTDLTKADVAMVGRIPVLKFHTVSLNEGQIFLKRLLDVVGALFGMVLFIIAFLIVGPLIKLESPGPVIFKQDRVGKNGRIFTMWKFRTMVKDAEDLKNGLMSYNEMDGHIFKIKYDPRITSIGSFLRKSSIDELPQFLNILRGDMSLVGTRPPTIDEYISYEAKQRCRLCITPGLTGIWQISGRSDIKDFDEIIRLDIDYISNWSLILDLHIILKTIGVVLSGRGSS